MCIIEKILELRKEKKGYKRIAKELGIGAQKVSDILIENKITDHVIMPPEDIVNRIVCDYQNGMSILECREKYKKREISSILKVAGCDVRPTCYHKNYSTRMNHDFFELIDSEEKAYLLGFFYADAYINTKKTCVEIGIAKKDIDILNKINECVGSSKNIEERKVNAFGKTFDAVRLTLYSKKMVEDLIRAGCYTQKTYTLTRPLDDVISKDLKRHFIRGYIDGDGCVCQTIVSIVGTNDILDYIIDDLRTNAGISNAGSFTMTGKAHQWNHNSARDVKKVFNYLYKDSNIYIDRKYNNFLKAMTYCRPRIKSQKS